MDKMKGASAQALTTEQLLPGKVFVAKPADFSTGPDPWKDRAGGMKCATCVWFVPKAHSVVNNGDLIRIGRCRRHAPAMNGYPAVYPADWCGDHRIDENKIGAPA